jgi:AcrR family transcriptional regulator
VAPRTERKVRRRLGVEGQRKALRDAAAEVFAARGFAECSVEDLLQAAGVSRQTFYRCYGSKDELLHDLHARVGKGVMESVASFTDAELDAANSVRRHFEILFARAAEAGPIVCELEREASRLDSPYRVHREQRRRYGIEYSRAWVAHHFGVIADPELVRGVVYAIEQLILTTAEAQRPSAVESGMRAATLLVEAALLRMGVSLSECSRRRNP